MNPETLKAMKEASEALKGVRKAVDISHADPRFVDFIMQCSPANVSALLTERDELEIEVERQAREIERLTTLIDTPHTDDWLSAVPLEAAHQVKRWGVEHGVGKTPLDWFWLIGYLAQKAAASALAGDVEKAKHHTVSTGAVLLNWFRRLTGDDHTFQPGIDPQQRTEAGALD